MTLSIEESFFTDSDTFGSENGLVVAALFLPAAGVPSDTERGELDFVSFSWDPQATSGAL